MTGIGRPEKLDFNGGSYTTFAGDGPQSATRRSNHPVSVGSHWRPMIKDMLFDMPAGLAVHERQAEMCIDGTWFPGRSELRLHLRIRLCDFPDQEDDDHECPTICCQSVARA